ncbi:MAG: hypothetical protein EHM40_02445 [Chloroflexi bacterium]|nr:MAG: hypothetical protein EHM40_02445 [Chloroflexota bacterium]
MLGAFFRVERFSGLSGFLSASLMLTLRAALFYITNWVCIVREVACFEAFGRPPLLQQLRSLGAEEQFYVLWPLSLLFLLRRLKRNRFGLLAATALLVAAFSTWMAVLTSPTAILYVYYGTDTRAAVIWSPGQAARSSSISLLELSEWAGWIALMSLYKQLNEFQPFLYRGGILVTALASALLMCNACEGWFIRNQTHLS